MKYALLLSLLCWSLGAGAQESSNNPIVGIWKRNEAESTAPGTPPQVEVREYREREDGWLVGLAVWVSASGRPGFLQFTAKSDGSFYPEHDSEALAALQSTGEDTQLAYAEKVIDTTTVEWIDHYMGEVTASGTKTFSADGRKMTILVNVPNRPSYTLVYDRQ